MKQFKQRPVQGRNATVSRSNQVIFEYPEGTPAYRRGFTAAGRPSNHFHIGLSTKRLSHHNKA